MQTIHSWLMFSNTSIFFHHSRYCQSYFYLGLSIHLTSDEQFNPNQVINLPNYSSLRSFRLFSDFKFFFSCPVVMNQETFRMPKCFSNFIAIDSFAQFSIRIHLSVIAFKLRCSAVNLDSDMPEECLS